MSFLHASPPRVIENGRSGISIIESSNTKSLLHPKKKYRDPLLEQNLLETTYIKPNIMFDPRVQRGTTAGKTAVLNATLGSTSSSSNLNSTLPRFDSSPLAASSSTSYELSKPPPSRPSKQQLIASGSIRPQHPSVAYIHSHLTVTKQRREVPIHLYLIEQMEPNLVHNLSQQTDAFMLEPPTPDYIPRKTGSDISTQVDNNLIFNFDNDVKFILEVIVSKSIEQALMEVREEEELSSIADHTLELRNKFILEENQSEELLRQERAKHELKLKILETKREQQKKIIAIRAKLAAQYFSKAYLSSLQDNVLNSLKKEGFFNAKDSLSHQLESQFIPSILSNIELTIHKEAGAKLLTDELLSQNLSKASKEKKEFLIAKEKKEINDLAEAKSAKIAAEDLSRRQERFVLRLKSNSSTFVFPQDKNPLPLYFTGESLISHIENRLLKFLSDRAEEDGLSLDELPKPEHLYYSRMNGEELDKLSPISLYDLGGFISSAGVELLVDHRIPPPPPEPEKEKGSGDEEDGNSDEEGSETDEKGTGRSRRSKAAAAAAEEEEEGDEDDV